MASNLLSLRKEAGLSQFRLGAEAGINQSHISRLERGLKSVTVDNALAIANVLSRHLGRPVTVEEVFGKEPARSNPNGKSCLPQDNGNAGLADQNSSHT